MTTSVKITRNCEEIQEMALRILRRRVLIHLNHKQMLKLFWSIWKSYHWDKHLRVNSRLTTPKYPSCKVTEIRVFTKFLSIPQSWFHEIFMRLHKNFLHSSSLKEILVTFHANVQMIHEFLTLQLHKKFWASQFLRKFLVIL